MVALNFVYSAGTKNLGVQRFILKQTSTRQSTNLKTSMLYNPAQMYGNICDCFTQRW